MACTGGCQTLLDLEHLPSNMVLWGESMAPDFWRYQVVSKISGFDLRAPISAMKTLPVG
jgi:hypothetical protein